eukprot:scaffold679_cov223-Amphora_coffeaeformis.AAC.1
MERTPGTTAVPKYNEVLDETQDADKPKIKARKANDDGYNELLLSIEDEVCFGLVDGAVTPDLPDGDLAKAWTALKNKFEPKTKTAMTDLKLDFTKCKMEEGEDPEEWITTLESYQWRLLKDFNVTISEDDLLIHIITNLTGEYETIVETETERIGAANDPLTVEGLKEKLRSKYARLKRNEKEGEDKALIMQADTNKSSNGQGNGNRFKGKCFHCGKRGHKKEDCRNKDKPPVNRGSGGGTGKSSATK